MSDKASQTLSNTPRPAMTSQPNAFGFGDLGSLQNYVQQLKARFPQRQQMPNQQLGLSQGLPQQLASTFQRPQPNQMAFQHANTNASFLRPATGVLGQQPRTPAPVQPVQQPAPAFTPQPAPAPTGVFPMPLGPTPVQPQMLIPQAPTMFSQPQSASPSVAQPMFAPIPNLAQPTFAPTPSLSQPAPTLAQQYMTAKAAGTPTTIDPSTYGGALGPIDPALRTRLLAMAGSV